jgi:hypothetical protein
MEAQAAQFMEQVQAGHPRIWFGETGADTSDPDKWIVRWLADHSYAAQADFHNFVSFYLFINGPLGTTQKSDVGAFGEHIRLQTALINSERLIPGEALLLNLQWQTDAPIAADDLVILKLTDERGVVWAEHRMLPCGGRCLTSDWPINETINDRHSFIIPVGTPPGAYRMMLELYHPPARASLPVRAPSSRALPEQNAAAGQAGSGLTNASALELSRLTVLPN